jgi:hypothetical protein
MSGMRKKYIVTLTEDERQHLTTLISTGKGAARRLAHARILLKADQGPGGPAETDTTIAAAVEVSRPTVERVRARFVEEGLEAALNPRPSQREYVPKIDGAAEAHLVALACGTPPAGHARWSLRLLASKVVELEIVESVSHETVRHCLKKTT